MNGPVRQVRGERMYPISAMGEYTSDGNVDVEGFCRNNNMVPVAVIVTGAIEDGSMAETVFLHQVPIGQDLRSPFRVPLVTGMIHDIAVRRVITATTTAEDVYILGINP